MSPSQDRPMRIAFTDTGGSQWTGGLTYRRNLLEALRQFAPQVEVYLITGQDFDRGGETGGAKVIKYPPTNSRLPGLISQVTRRLFGYDLLLQQALRTVPGGVDILFPGRFTAGGKTALLFWIPDFQFIHLPEMYSKAQRLALEKKYRQGIRRAALVVLSSCAAQEDFNQFAPQHAAKARVMNFVARIPANLFDTDPQTIARQYHLPGKFFYLPNQFWAHKNHAIVLEALKILGDRNMRPFVVFSGNPIDSRQPLHFAGLMQKVSLWGLRDQVAFLGLAPHEHVYALMRQSICVLNPSLFEGWSTTVEEAKSVGVRLLLSDLAVHREQDPPGAVYFDRHNAKDLAGKLAQLWVDLAPGPDLELERQARQAYPGRIKTYADTFVAIAREAIAIARGRKDADVLT